MVPGLKDGTHHRRRPGFTLAEVMVVLALFGLIASLAFAPSVSLVRRLEEVRSEIAGEQQADYRMGRLAAELRRSPRNFPDGPAVVSVRHDVLGGQADDRLAFWSDWGGITGVRAWMIHRPGVSKRSAPGMYRWILPLASPSAVDWDALDPEEGYPVIPGAVSLRIAVLDHGAAEWSDEFAGSRPRGIRITVKKGEEEFSREEWLPPE